MWILILSITICVIFYIFFDIKNNRIKFLQDEFSGIFNQEVLDKLQLFDPKFDKNYLIKVLYEYKFVKKNYEDLMFFYNISKLINIVLKLKSNINKLNIHCLELSDFLDFQKNGKVVSISINQFFSKLFFVEELVDIENFDQFIQHQTKILYIVFLSKNEAENKEIIKNLNKVITNQYEQFEFACLELDRVVTTLDYNTLDLYKKSS